MSYLPWRLASYWAHGSVGTRYSSMDGRLLSWLDMFLLEAQRALREPAATIRFRSILVDLGAWNAMEK